MAVAAPVLEQQVPRLVFFHSTMSGHCRRVEGFLAQVLQRRRNHGTFALVRVAEEQAMAKVIEEHWDKFVELSLREEGVRV